MTVGAVVFRPMNRLSLQDVVVRDNRDETMISCRDVEVKIDSFSFVRKQFTITEVALNELYFDLYLERGEPVSTMNIEVFIDSLARLSTSPPDTVTTNSGASWNIDIKKVSIKNSRFLYNEDIKDTINYGVNWTDIDCRELNVELSGFDFQDSVSYISLDHLSLVEKSGLTIRNISGLAAFKEGNFVVSNGEVKLAETTLDLLKLEYNWTPDNQDWKNFVTRMYQYYELGPSTVSFNDIAYFNDNVLGMDNIAKCSGIVYNTVHQIQGKDLFIEYGDNCYLEGEFQSWGLPNVFDTHFEAKMKRGRIAPTDLETIYLPWMDYKIALPETLHKLPYIDIADVRFCGKLQDFSLDLVAQDFNVKGPIHFELLEENEGVMDMKGHFNFFDVNARLFADNTLLNRMAAKGEYAAIWKDSLSFNINVNDAKMHVGKTSVTGIEATADYDAQGWNLLAKIQDTAINGMFTAYGENNALFSYGDFNVKHIERFAEIDSLLHGALSLKYHLDYVKQPQGGSNAILRFDSICFAANERKCEIDSILIRNTINEGNILTTSVKSDVLNLDINGNYWGASPIIVAKKVLDNYMSVASPQQRVRSRNRHDGYDIRYDATFTNPDKVLNVFVPSLSIKGNATMSAEINERDMHTRMVLKADTLQYDNIVLTSPYFRLQGDGSELVSQCRAKQVAYNNVYNLYNLYGDVAFGNHQIRQRLTWCNWGEKTFSGEIASTTRLTQEGKEIHADITLHPGVIMVDDTLWRIKPTNITWNKEFVTIDDLALTCGNQSLELSGTLSDVRDEHMKLSLRQFSLKEWAQLLTDRDFYGVVTGDLILKRRDTDHLVLADMAIKNSGLGLDSLGDFALRSFWDSGRDRLQIRAENTYRGENPFLINGHYKPKTDSLDLRIDLNTIEVNRFEHYFSESLSQLQGAISGRMKVVGTPHKPVINGIVCIDSISAELNALKAKVIINDSIRIQNNNLYFNDFIVRSPNNGLAAISGHWDLYNQRMGVDVRMDNFAVMNTTVKDNNSLYGKLNLSGSVLMTQESGRAMDVTVNLRPEKESHLFIPMSASGSATNTDFLHFVDLEKDIAFAAGKQEIIVENNIVMNANIELNNNLNVDVIFDPVVGDILRTNGEGNIKLTLDGDGILNMFGNYEIHKGDYLFTLSNLLNKRFALAQGGKITWTGSPFDASIDVNAVYSLKAPLNELLPESESGDKTGNVERGKKVPVECVLNLSERLANPNVKFAIDFPSLETQTRSYLESLFASQDEINKQVFSLLLLNRFYRTNDENSQYMEKTGMASITTVTEMMSGQLSRWLSQISNNLDIGFAYRVGEDEITADEIEVALSTQLLNDRVTISANGNMDVGNKHTASTGGNNIAGDFDMDVKLNQQGTLKLKAYSHTNEKILYNNTETIQGVGISYQETFDTFKDLVRKYLKFLFKEQKDEV
ncbi:MAG: translocation/assembly module TamB domain-containing protein [Marinifilaceae bacterium]